MALNAISRMQTSKLYLQARGQTTATTTQTAVEDSRNGLAYDRCGATTYCSKHQNWYVTYLVDNFIEAATRIVCEVVSPGRQHRIQIGSMERKEAQAFVHCLPPVSCVVVEILLMGVRHRCS